MPVWIILGVGVALLLARKRRGAGAAVVAAIALLQCDKQVLVSIPAVARYYVNDGLGTPARWTACAETSAC